MANIPVKGYSIDQSVPSFGFKRKKKRRQDGGVTEGTPIYIKKRILGTIKLKYQFTINISILKSELYQYFTCSSVYVAKGDCFNIRAKPNYEKLLNKLFPVILTETYFINAKADYSRVLEVIDEL
jgi:hypothetical protein